MTTRLLTAAALSLYSLAATAGTFPDKTVPATATWIVHANVKSFRTSALGKDILAQLEEGKTKAQLDVLGNLLKLDPRRDLDAMTIFGPDRDDKQATFVAKGAFDEAAILALLQASDLYTSTAHEGHTLHRFEAKERREAGVDHGQLGWLCLLDPKTVVLGWNIERVQETLDAHDTRVPNLATTGNVLWGNIPDQAAFLAVAADLAALGDLGPQAAMLRQATGLALSLNEAAGEVQLRLVLGAASPEAARQMAQAAQGMVAMAGLAAANDPRQAWVANLARNVVISAEGQTIGIAIDQPAAEIKALIDRLAAGRQRGQR